MSFRGQFCDVGFVVCLDSKKTSRLARQVGRWVRQAEQAPSLLHWQRERETLRQLNLGAGTKLVLIAGFLVLQNSPKVKGNSQGDEEKKKKKKRKKKRNKGFPVYANQHARFLIHGHEGTVQCAHQCMGAYSWYQNCACLIFALY